MASKYEVFCTVVQYGNFTKAAQKLSYSQSAISQTVKALEQELGCTLLTREKSGVTLTYDGQHYYPFIRSLYNAEQALHQKQQEMRGLENTVIKVGAFTSVSRTLLPPIMRQFKNEFPQVRFVLMQGEYSSIADWITNGSVDFGFINKEHSDLKTEPLFEDEMMAVLPKDHPLAARESLSLKELTEDPFIVLGEGRKSVALEAFEQAGLQPKIEYTVYDDYTIAAMVEQHLGISMMYRLLLSSVRADVSAVPIREHPHRTIALAWKNNASLSLAAGSFLNFIAAHCRQN